ncbi:MAG: cytochrome-c oxidase, cbb3-type subunit III [Gammaproteobacteria bacterium]|nr:cytochrome-c oxidase, cbb3-type subunit III [Gammaproteobacteria bacterium]
MADLPNDFWSAWIAIITVISFVALAWIVFSIYFSGKDSKTATEESVEPVWDNDLREGNNAPPLWWFWLIFSAMIFSVIYLILYPGMGAFKGVLNWSQDSRLDDSYEVYNDQFGDKRIEISASSLSKLQNNTGLMTTAERIFTRNCAACHGEDGRGQASLFPNLMDVDWQWGSSAQQIEQSIRLGRNAMMPSWQAALGDEGVDQVASYVMTIGSEEADSHPGKAQYNQFCVACHGADGAGNPLLGAPNLNDDSWIYGGSVEDIKRALVDGRNGVMPAFNDRLDDAQIKLLVAFLVR